MNWEPVSYHGNLENTFYVIAQNFICNNDLIEKLNMSILIVQILAKQILKTFVTEHFILIIVFKIPLTFSTIFGNLLAYLAGKWVKRHLAEDSQYTEFIKTFKYTKF